MTMSKKTMSKKEIKIVYDQIKQLHQQHLQERGVRLPRLYNAKKQFTIDALTLVFLARGYPATQWVSKAALTQFIRKYHPNTNDVQSACQTVEQENTSGQILFRTDCCGAETLRRHFP